MNFRVDPDSLTAASHVALRQDAHLDVIDGYISSACSNFGAFSGVLNLFQASYESAVQTAHDGLADSRAVARTMSDALIASRDDYLDTDREVYEWFRARFSDLVPFPPYDPPGSGNSNPGGPTNQAGAARPPGAGDDPVSLPNLPWMVDKPLGQAFPTDVDTPGWLDPKSASKDWFKDMWRRNSGDEYDYYRSLGYNDKEALALARADHPDSSTRADTRNYDQMQQRSRDAYEQGYRDARANGATPAEARDAAREAGHRQFADDSADRNRRTELRDGVGTAKAIYDEAGNLIGNVQDLHKNVTNIKDNAEDLGRYDDYESRGKDTSAQEWAGR
jgi:hypothetical protein